MKKQLITLLSGAAIILAGCNKNMADSSATAGSIRIDCTIGSRTKVPVLDENGSGGFAEGDRFTIATSQGLESVKSSEYIVGQEWLTWGELGYSPGTKVTFAACYPVAELSQEGSCSFDCHAAQYKDLLLAVPQEMDPYTTSPVVLNFRHALHLLVVNFNADLNDYTEEEMNSLRLRCTARKSCTVDVINGVLGETGSTKATFESTGKNNSFIFPPQPTSDVHIEFSVGGVTTSMSLSDLIEKLGGSQIQLNGGSRMILNITISRNDITNTPIETGDISIESWEDQGTVSGTIDMDSGNGEFQVSFKPLTAWGEPVSFDGASTVLNLPGDETSFELNPSVYYWYTTLNEGQKKLYGELRKKAAVFNDGGSPLPRVTFNVDGVYSTDDINAVSSAFSKDQSSFFHFNRLYGSTSNRVTAGFNSPYSTFAYRYRLFTERVDEILGRMPVGLNEFAKAKWLWDEFLKSVSYGQKEGSEGTVYGAFVLQKVVCEGYARGYQYLCQRAGIQALYVEGTASNSAGGIESHAWNVVRIDGNYYLADPTWDDGMSAGSDAVFYKLFLKGSTHKDFVNRTLASGYEYPTISKNDYPHGL